MSIGSLAQSFAEAIVKNSSNPSANVKQIKLGLHIILNYLLVFITVAIVSALLDNLFNAIVSFFAFALLRFFSGSSWHFKNDIHCYLFSSVVLTVVPLIKLHNDLFDPNYISLLLIIIFAPSSRRIKRKSVKGFVFKCISLLIVIFHIGSFKIDAVTSVFLLQSLSLIPFRRSI